MELESVHFQGGSNVELLDAIRGVMDPLYQSRVPDATRAGLNATMNAMSNYGPAMNQFIDALVDMFGAQIIRYNTWTNPLAKYKQGFLQSGTSIEEVAIGLVKAEVYKADAESLAKEVLGRRDSEVQTVFHKVNRQEKYATTINSDMLERAFLNPNGLSEMISGLMAALNTSDNVDEFLQTTSTLRRYYDAGGFYKLNVPDIGKASLDESTNTNKAKTYLRSVREMADTLPFMSRKYNARHMMMKTDPGDLELILTPAGKAAIDVDGLANLFNIEKGNITQRITVVPDEYIGIPGFQGILTSRRFWIIADKLIRTTNMFNPDGLYNNYWLHHHEVISASPFENAILLSSEEDDAIVINDYRVTGLTAYTLIDITDSANPTPVTVTGTGDGTATVQRGHAYLVKIAATTDPAGGPLDAVTLDINGNNSNQTHVNQYGILTVSQNEDSDTLVIHGKATDDNTFQANLTLTTSGTLVSGSVGLEADDAPKVIENTRKPGITPANGGPVGTELTVNHGSWDADDLEFAVQWKRDGSAISGANTLQYLTVTADGGHAISATVTASRTGFTAGSATSNPVNIAVAS